METVCLPSGNRLHFVYKTQEELHSIYPEKLVEAVLEATRSNLRACRFQKFPEGAFPRPPIIACFAHFVMGILAT